MDKIKNPINIYFNLNIKISSTDIKKIRKSFL